MPAARRFVRFSLALTLALALSVPARASRPVDSGCPPCESPRPTGARAVIGVGSTATTNEAPQPAAPTNPRTAPARPGAPRTLARAKRPAKPLPATPGMGSLLRASSGPGVELS